MKTIFIKSGGYYETPGVAVACAVNIFHKNNFGQFNKIDLAFKLDFIDGEYRLYLASHIPGASALYKTVDLDFLADQVEKYGFAYFGTVTQHREILTHDMALKRLSTIYIDPETETLIDAVTQIPYKDANILPIIYGVKIAKGIYSFILSGMARVNSLPTTVDENNSYQSKRIRNFDNSTIICVNDGESIRDMFVDLKFKNALKHFKNNDLTIGFAVFTKPEQSVEIDIFKEVVPFITTEFKDSFEIIVESNFNYIIDNYRIIFETPKDRVTGYMSIKLMGTDFYQEVSSREIKEILSFDLIVSVL